MASSLKKALKSQYVIKIASTFGKPTCTVELAISLYSYTQLLHCMASSLKKALKSQ